MWYKNVGIIFFSFVTEHTFDRRTDRKALAISCVVLHRFARWKRHNGAISLII